MVERPADASTLIYLAKANGFDLARTAVEALTVPPAVWEEAVVAGRDRGAPDVVGIEEARDTGFLRLAEWSTTLDRDAAAIRDGYQLGLGESQVIALGSKVGAAVIDEGRASRVAESLGIDVISTLLLPVIAVRRGMDGTVAVMALRRMASIVGVRADVLVTLEAAIAEEKG
jgi:predicted nucleic acid-binding protein